MDETGELFPVRMELLDWPASVIKGSTRVIVAELKISHLGEDMQFGAIPVGVASHFTVKGEDGEDTPWVAEVNIVFGSVDLPNANAVMKQDFEHLVYVFINNMPDEEGPIIITIEGWTLLGVESGNIHQLTGSIVKTIEVVSPEEKE